MRIEQKSVLSKPCQGCGGFTKGFEVVAEDLCLAFCSGCWWPAFAASGGRSIAEDIRGAYKNAVDARSEASDAMHSAEVMRDEIESAAKTMGISLEGL